MKRRRFLQTTAALTLSTSAIKALSAQRYLTACNGGKPIAAADSPPLSDSPENPIPTDWQWRELAAIQDHLFPPEPDAPGAGDIDALPYLRSILADPKLRPELEALLVDGMERLRQLLRSEDHRDFSALGEDRKEAVLRRLEKESIGRRFLDRLLHYILEACLTDPVYGGNPKEIGWQWLGFEPGYKRPTPKQRYFLLTWVA
uniref:Gluconate 2-dehydrogenase gamma chain n=1 Tax=Candidatus Kentrum sp. LFY TaxID=2126342 RepID=A0A450UGS8_9GAMM|nr:MAG: gluconate 2-dehydrogenase gamma chain [Candidatus Kentron sp. LFY]